MSLSTCPQTGEPIAFTDPVTSVIVALESCVIKLERNQPIDDAFRAELVQVLRLSSSTLDEFWHADCTVSLDEFEGEDFEEEEGAEDER